MQRSVQERLAKSVHTGFERTAIQDIGHGLRQLTDVANKALSAVHALGHISALLCEIAAHDLGPLLLRDNDQRVRVVLHRPELSDLVDVAIAQPRRYGASDPQAMQRLFELLSELAWHCRPAQRPVVNAQLERLLATVHGVSAVSLLVSPVSLLVSPGSVVVGWKRSRLAMVTPMAASVLVSPVAMVSSASVIRPVSGSVARWAR